MLLPLGYTYLRNSVLRIAIFSIIILILGDIPCWSGKQTVMVVAVDSAGPSPLTEGRSANRSTTTEPIPDYEKPPPGAEFAKACYDLVTNFTYSAIVAHNMDVTSAGRMHHARDRESFYKLAENLSKTIMKFVEQLDQIGVLFSVNGDVPVDMYAPMSCKPEKKVDEEEHAVENSNTIVPWLLFVILVLVVYIGYLSYRMKIKYHRNSSTSVLIEDH